MAKRPILNVTPSSNMPSPPQSTSGDAVISRAMAAYVDVAKAAEQASRECAVAKQAWLDAQQRHTSAAKAAEEAHSSLTETIHRVHSIEK